MTYPKYKDSLFTFSSLSKPLETPIDIAQTPTSTTVMIQSDCHVADFDDVWIDNYDRMEKRLFQRSQEALEKDLCETLAVSDKIASTVPANKPGRAVVQELVDHAEFLSPDDFEPPAKDGIGNAGVMTIDNLYELSKRAFESSNGGVKILGDGTWIILDDYSPMEPYMWENSRTDNQNYNYQVGSFITKKTIVSGS